MVDETRNFTVMFMAAPEALAGIASIDITDIINSRTFNVHPNNEPATVQEGAGNLRIDMTLANLGADGNLFLQLLRDDNLVLIDSEQYITEGAAGYWGVTADMPSRNVSFTVNAGHESAPPPGQTFTLRLTATTGGVTDPPVGDYTQIAGSTLTLEAFPDEFAWFAGWILDSVLITDNPITITFDGDHELIAYFVSG